MRCRHFDPSVNPVKPVKPGGRQSVSKVSPGKGPVPGGFQYRPFIDWARDVAKGADTSGPDGSIDPGAFHLEARVDVDVVPWTNVPILSLAPCAMWFPK